MVPSEPVKELPGLRVGKSPLPLTEPMRVLRKPLRGVIGELPLHLPLLIQQPELSIQTITTVPNLPLTSLPLKAPGRDQPSMHLVNPWVEADISLPVLPEQPQQGKPLEREQPSPAS